VRDHIQYLKYVIRHKWFVFKGRKRAGCSLWLALIHDWSKFLPVEWIPYTHSFYNKDGSKRKVRNADGSYDPTKVNKEFDYAWRHHQGSNKHHWQYWVLINDEDGTYPLEMPEKYVREMIADWIGAGMAIAGRKDPNPWYQTNKHKMVLHDVTRKLVEDILEELKDE